MKTQNKTKQKKIKKPIIKIVEKGKIDNSKVSNIIYLF
jgi:hypothetical protein